MSMNSEEENLNSIEGAMDILRKARWETVKDCVDLLKYLKSESSSTHYQEIDNMINRMQNMMKTL